MQSPPPPPPPAAHPSPHPCWPPRLCLSWCALGPLLRRGGAGGGATWPRARPLTLARLLLLLQALRLHVLFGELLLCLQLQLALNLLQLLQDLLLLLHLTRRQPDINLQRPYILLGSILSF